MLPFAFCKVAVIVCLARFGLEMWRRYWEWELASSMESSSLLLSVVDHQGKVLVQYHWVSKCRGLSLMPFNNVVVKMEASLCATTMLTCFNCAERSCKLERISRDCMVNRMYLTPCTLLFALLGYWDLLCWWMTDFSCVALFKSCWRQCKDVCLHLWDLEFSLLCSIWSILCPYFTQNVSTSSNVSSWLVFLFYLLHVMDYFSWWDHERHLVILPPSCYPKDPR
jgi:hypothetical protein